MHSLRHYLSLKHPATTEISPLSLHDALPISTGGYSALAGGGIAAHQDSQTPGAAGRVDRHALPRQELDRKSTRLNSSHVSISYAVFCLKKKKIEARRCECHTPTTLGRDHY